jgi:hypothetical protein
MIESREEVAFSFRMWNSDSAGATEDLEEMLQPAKTVEEASI